MTLAKSFCPMDIGQPTLKNTIVNERYATAIAQIPAFAMMPAGCSMGLVIVAMAQVSEMFQEKRRSIGAKQTTELGRFQDTRNPRSR